MAVTADLIVDNADVVYTCAGDAPFAGARQRDAGPMPHASVASARGVIVFVGDEAACRDTVTLASDGARIDAQGRTLVPGFVDPHTHLVFAGDRRHELQQRLAGATYADIAARGGGIVHTVAATRAASEHELVAAALPRLASMIACGTTTAEVKSGYGLDVVSELTTLRAIRALATAQPIELVATFLGAHEIPVEFRSRRDAYVRLLVDEMIPAIARDHLAEWCDVFCENGVFTPAEARTILQAGQRFGLKSRIHADELGLSGGSAVAADVGARSADHLIFIDEPHARAMVGAGVIATLLPAAAFFLKLGRFAPARLLIDVGVPVALATDINPGGGFSPSMPFAMTLACFGMHMTLEEALVASTANAAASLDLQGRVGSLEPGKQMDAVVIDGTLADIVRVGGPIIHRVIKRGRTVWPTGGMFPSSWSS
ncbi:MAG: imidazolonepropionase [Vicinamibacterales bacterium]